MDSPFQFQRYDTNDRRQMTVRGEGIRAEIVARSSRSLRPGSPWSAPTVSWSSIGSVDLETARLHAEAILEACRVAEETLQADDAPQAAPPAAVWKVFYGGLWLASLDGEDFYTVEQEPTPANVEAIVERLRAATAAEYVWKRAKLEELGYPPQPVN